MFKYEQNGWNEMIRASIYKAHVHSTYWNFHMLLSKAIIKQKTICYIQVENKFRSQLGGGGFIKHSIFLTLNPQNSPFKDSRSHNRLNCKIGEKGENFQD